MYWRIGPRYRDRPRADNKEDLRRLAASERPPGLLAFDGDRAAGWCELAPRGALGWLARAPPGLRASEGDGAAGWCELAPRAELGWLARARYLEPVDDLPVWSAP